MFIERDQSLKSPRTLSQLLEHLDFMQQMAHDLIRLTEIKNNKEG